MIRQTSTHSPLQITINSGREQGGDAAASSEGQEWEHGILVPRGSPELKSKRGVTVCRATILLSSLLFLLYALAVSRQLLPPRGNSRIDEGASLDKGKRILSAAGVPVGSGHTQCGQSAAYFFHNFVVCAWYQRIAQTNARISLSLKAKRTHALTITPLISGHKH